MALRSTKMVTCAARGILGLALKEQPLDLRKTLTMPCGIALSYIAGIMAWWGGHDFARLSNSTFLKLAPETLLNPLAPAKLYAGQTSKPKRRLERADTMRLSGASLHNRVCRGGGKICGTQQSKRLQAAHAGRSRELCAKLGRDLSRSLYW